MRESQEGVAKSLDRLAHDHAAASARQFDETRSSMRESGELSELRAKAVDQRLSSMQDALNRELALLAERQAKLGYDLSAQAAAAERTSSETEKARLLDASEQLKRLDNRLDTLQHSLKGELAVVSEQQKEVKAMNQAMYQRHEGGAHSAHSAQNEQSSRINSVGERVAFLGDRVDSLLGTLKDEFAGMEQVTRTTCLLILILIMIHESSYGPTFLVGG